MIKSKNDGHETILETVDEIYTREMKKIQFHL